MEKRFDDIFSRKVKEIFDDYQDDSVDSAWALLKENLPEKKSDRKPVFWFFAGLAASFILIFTWHFFIREPAVSSLQQSARSSVNPPAQAPASPAPAAKPKNLAENVPANSMGMPAYPSSKFGREQHLSDIPVTHTEPAASGSKVHLARIYKAGGRRTVKKPGRTAIDSVPKNMTALIVYLPSQGGQSETEMKDSKISLTSQAEQISWDHLPNVTRSRIKKSPKDAGRSLRLGVFAGSYLSYAKGSQQKADLGGGLTGSIRLAGHLSLGSGIALSPSHLQYDASGTGLASARMAARILPKNQSSPSLEANYRISETPQYTGLAANLLGLEVPLNLIYDFHVNRFQAFVSAGLGSDALLKENYSLQYQTGGQASSQPAQNEASAGRSAFNFARLLDLSVGWSYPLGGGRRLQVEPFLKYPLRPAGQQQLNYGYGGLNLKFSFHP